MTEKQREELQDLLQHEKHGNLYDFICDNYWDLSREDLKDLCKEAYALLYEKAERENVANGKDYDNYKALHEEYYNTLKDNTTIFED